MKRRRVGIRGSVTPGQILTALPALFSRSHRTRPAAQRRQDRLDLPHETPIEALGLQWDDDAPADEREMSALQWDVLRKRSAATADVPKDGAANDTAADTSDVPLSGRPRSNAPTRLQSPNDNSHPCARDLDLAWQVLGTVARGPLPIKKKRIKKKRIGLSRAPGPYTRQ
jgi:hypothetical protein